MDRVCGTQTPGATPTPFRRCRLTPHQRVKPQVKEGYKEKYSLAAWSALKSYSKMHRHDSRLIVMWKSVDDNPVSQAESCRMRPMIRLGAKIMIMTGVTWKDLLAAYYS